MLVQGRGSTRVVIENPGAFRFYAHRCLPVVEAHVETSRHQVHYSSRNFHLRLHSNPRRIANVMLRVLEDCPHAISPLLPIVAGQLQRVDDAWPP